MIKSIKKEDIKYIRRCFTLAKKGRGSVSPNPMVGAVLVKEGKVIGEGWHKKYGHAHAEAMAFQNVKVDTSGATLYVNLEPCCHTKKQTPPCLPLIVSKKIKRVVTSNEDPNPDVSGRGFNQLRLEGIEVTTGVCSEEGDELNRFYFNYARTELPYIILKIAQSIDGKIGFNNREQKWLTGDESKKFVHQMRAQCDAVLVGVNTVRVDNPQLSVREFRGRNPIRVIVDGNLTVPMNSALAQPDDTNQTVIFTSNGNDAKKVLVLKDRGIEIIRLTGKHGVLDLEAVLKILGERKIISLFVEGGQSIFSQFIEKELFDEIVLLQAPLILGKGESAFTNKYKKKLFVQKVDSSGKDIKIVLKKI